MGTLHQSVVLDTNCYRMGSGGHPRKKGIKNILVGIVAPSLLGLESHRSIQHRESNIDERLTLISASLSLAMV